MKHLEGLNDAQRKAASIIDGPVLILAGAGAGKTKTIAHRILHLVLNGVAPEQILAITFTNKAAKEMRERVFNLLQENGDLNRPISITGQPFISTFHGLGAFIIKENAGEAQRTRHFSIYDKGDSKRAVREALEGNGYNPKEFDPGKILSAISREKGAGISANEYEARESDFGGRRGNYFGRVISETWISYEKILKKENALDFDDLVLIGNKLLKKKEIGDKYRGRWKFIHIDEYQDTNKVQYEMALSLSEEEGNICAVGDIDQNIYSWRGANIRNILNFEKDFPRAELVVLEENYRSTQTILAIANRLIKKNKLRREKNLVTRNAVGEKASIFEALNEEHEASFVTEKIKKLSGGGVPLSEIAVLYRANFQSRVLEEACLAANLPYQVLGTRFFERKEIKDLISYLRLAWNPESVPDLKRVINSPARGIGKTSLLKVVEGREDSLPAKTRMKVLSFRELIKRVKKFSSENKLSQTLNFIAEESGILKELSDSPEDVERVENIKELIVLSKRYDNLDGEEGVEKFLEETSLVSDQDSDKENAEAVRLMTVHASKGLEFSYVFIVGLEEGLFPHDKDRDENVSEEEAEEERRLFYVAVTRAKKKLFLSYAATRTIFGSRGVNIPSEFVLEIPEEYTEREFLDYSPKRKSLLHIEF